LSGAYCRPQVTVDTFGERACARGTIGRIHAKRLMGLMLAHALKLRKFGA